MMRIPTLLITSVFAIFVISCGGGTTSPDVVKDSGDHSERDSPGVGDHESDTKDKNRCNDNDDCPDTGYCKRRFVPTVRARAPQSLIHVPLRLCPSVVVMAQLTTTPAWPKRLG